MKKNDLIAKITEQTGLTKKDVTTVTNSLFNTITNALGNGDKVQITGFGSFEAHNRDSRMGKNPRTKESMIIPACTVPTFRSGKALKEAVNK